MVKKNLNSKSYVFSKKETDEKMSGISTDGSVISDLEDFMDDEEPENFESQKEDIENWLNKTINKVDEQILQCK